jgi:dTDP-4-dehydrorhamnose 3,5-epimerase
MSLRIEATGLDGLVLAHLHAHPDARGSFRELFRAEHFAAAGLPATIAQVNGSISAKGVVRGLHFQWEPPMAKAMRIVRGRAFLAAVDVRAGSATFGRAWWRESAAGEDLWVCAPAGFARGFQALEDGTEVEYLCSAAYAPASEGGIRWDDPALGIPWPIPQALVSDKDRAAPTLAEWRAGPQGKVFAI